MELINSKISLGNPMVNIVLELISQAFGTLFITTKIQIRLALLLRQIEI